MTRPSSKPPALPPPDPAPSLEEMALIASEFAKDFERLMAVYKIEKYDIWVKSPIFQLRFQKKE